MAKQSGQQSRRAAAQMHALAAVRREIQSRDSITGCKYLREFAEAFERYDSVLQQDEFEQRICSADLLLVADYHALPASQRFAAGLIEVAARHRPMVLGVEAVLARDQRVVDSWWRRELNSDELRGRLHFDRDWGYPWEPFYELLGSARDQAEGVYGLDCVPREDLRRIRSRDRHAALKIREIRERHPKAAILVLFGESHMAPGHLPRALRGLMPEAKILTVLQNVDPLYWQALGQQTPSDEIAPVSVGEDIVCVFNSSPLEKYESYRLALNRWNAIHEERPDFTPAIYNLIFSLARSLGLRLSSPSNGTQPKFLADSLPEVLTLDEKSEHYPQLAEKNCLYLPESNSLLVREFQIGQAAEQCARFLHFACRGMTPVCAQAQPIAQALARFGSRLLLPELKPETPTTGDALYEAYLNARISKTELRQIFLAHLETREQVQHVLTQISKFANA